MLGVVIYEIGSDGRDRVAGSLRLVGNKLKAFPTVAEDELLLTSILTSPARGNKYSPRPVLAQNDPIKFLTNLQYMYHGAYLRASKPTNL